MEGNSKVGIIDNVELGIDGRRDIDAIWQWNGTIAEYIAALLSRVLDPKIKYIQDTGEKTAGKLYLDKFDGQLYQCIVTTSSTSNISEYFVLRSILNIYHLYDTRLVWRSQRLVSADLGDPYRYNMVRINFTELSKHVRKVWFVGELKITCSWGYIGANAVHTFWLAAYADHNSSSSDFCSVKYLYGSAYQPTQLCCRAVIDSNGDKILEIINKQRGYSVDIVFCCSDGVSTLAEILQSNIDTTRYIEFRKVSIPELGISEDQWH